MGKVARKPAKTSAEKVKTSVVVEPVSLEETLLDVKVGDLHPGLSQYRKHFDEAKVRALAENMKRLGQLDRLVVRKRKAGGYEIVSGERRWRAAKLVGLPRLRCTLRVLTDEQAYEVAIAGNTQREDPHPLEECDGFVVLHDTYKRTVEQIADKVNRPVVYVYERLALRDLGAAARKAMLDDRIGLGVARLLSRVRPEKVQAEALKAILHHVEPPDRPSISRARDTISREYMLRLAEAPFDVKAAGLVPSAGACTLCPKNSATQGALFGEGLGKDDLCTDSPCWDRKVRADAEDRIERARREGKVVLNAAETKRLFPHGDQLYSQEYVSLDAGADPYAYGDDAKRTWRKVLGKRLEGVQIVVTKNPSGGVVELALKKDLVRVAKASPLATDPGFLRPKEQTQTSPKEKTRREKEKRDEAIGETARRLLLGQVVDAVGRDQLAEEVERLVLDVVLAEAVEHTTLKDVCERRDLTILDDDPEVRSPTREPLIRWRADASRVERRALLVELLCHRRYVINEPIRTEDDSETGWLQHHSVLEAFARALGVNIGAAEREAEREIEEAAPKKKRKGAASDVDGPVHTTKLRGPRKKKVEEAPVEHPTLAEAYGPGPDPLTPPAGDDGEDW